jgi:GntR family transcriptional regulator, transcriptional repressor for pyruvate dehydrogenase complex
LRGGRSDRIVEGSAEQVVGFVRDLIRRGRLRPGDRLPPERTLAARVGVSRPTVRMGLHALAAMGAVQSRHGSGTYIPAGPPVLGAEPLSLLAALHGFSSRQMWDARRILEVGAVGLAAHAATPRQLAIIAAEAAEVFEAIDDPQRFLAHDIAFHRAVASASGNPIIATFVEMVSSLYYERRRVTVARASELDRREAAQAHQRIYEAVHRRDADAARRTMNDHLLQASAHQALEPEDPRPPRPRRRRGL